MVLCVLYVGLVVNIFCVGTYYTYVNVQFVGKKIINEFNEELYLSQLHTNIVLKKKRYYKISVHCTHMLFFFILYFTYVMI